jgi:mRNA interferase RelE/StbE
MSYELRFKKSALKEWSKLGETIQAAFKKQLEERLQHPHVRQDKLRETPDCYKIKLQTAGYRLIYQVDDNVITVTVITIGQRGKNRAYRLAKRRSTD